MSSTPQLVLFEEDHKKLVAVSERLTHDANAKAVFLLDRNGQLVTEAGELKGIDTTSLSSLVAGNVAATTGLAKVIGEPDFPIHFHQGERDNVHITLVAQADHHGGHLRRPQLVGTRPAARQEGRSETVADLR